MPSTFVRYVMLFRIRTLCPLRHKIVSVYGFANALDSECILFLEEGGMEGEGYLAPDDI